MWTSVEEDDSEEYDSDEDDSEEDDSEEDNSEETEDEGNNAIPSRIPPPLLPFAPDNQWCSAPLLPQ